MEGRKFCQYCRITRPIEGGKFIKPPKASKRWRCEECLKRSAEPQAERDARGALARQQTREAAQRAVERSIETRRTGRIPKL